MPLALRSLVAMLLLCVATTAAFADEDADRIDGRATPHFQSLDLRLDPAAKRYSGHTEIELTVNERVSTLRLHAFEMNLGSVTIRDAAGKTTELSWTEAEAGLVNLSATAPLALGDYVLRIEFDNDYDHRAKALYQVAYEDEDYLFSQFEAVDARGAFPCFDEPNFKIEWEVTIEAPSTERVFCNTPVESETEVNGWTTTRFARTKKMPSYLVAIAVGPFETVDIPGLGFPGRVITPKGKAHLAQHAAEFTAPLLRGLESYFDRPYPYAKLDLIAVPEYLYGAMENVGLITFRDTILLIDPETATVAEKRRLASVDAHELAHMWYGNLVTMDWWDDLWLNESFATWMGNKITDQVFPEFELGVTGVRGKERAMGIDARMSATAMRAPVLAAEVETSLDPGIAYQKGEVVLGMFETFLGEEVFRDGVRSYIADNAWGNTVADDLLGSLSDASGVDVSAAMKTFLDQPGVPNLRITALGDGKVELTQSRFLNMGAEPTGDESWQIPVVFKYSDGKQVRSHRVLLDQPTVVIDLPSGSNPDWIHPNLDERGYYRWELGTQELFDLVDRSADVLEPRERVALVGQLSAQLGAGRIGGGDYMRACSVLASDPEASVLAASLSALGEVRFAFVTEDLASPFRTWVHQMCGPPLERFGLVPRADEKESVNLVRPALIRWMGRWGEDAEVRSFAREIADRYLEDRSSVDASIASACLNVAAIEGDWKLYNAYKTAFEAADEPNIRTRFLGALGAFGNRGMQDAALDYSLRGPLRTQEIFAIPQTVGASSMGDEGRTWDWFVENYDTIFELMPPNFRPYLPYFAGGSCSEERLAIAREFFSQPEHEVAGQARQLERVGEGIVECAQMRAREGESVRSYLAHIATAD